MASLRGILGNWKEALDKIVIKDGNVYLDEANDSSSSSGEEDLGIEV